MEKSRTKNAVKNVKTGFMLQIISKVLAFIVRTVFIKVLNSEYLGVNGLFTNILTMLSFAELGIGTAIIFNMYKPVAEEDEEKIKSLMKLYKKAYNTIGIVVFLLGICVIPFMKYIIKEVPNIKENIIFIYVLFLINTSSSYFFTYKKSIISAHQQESIINKLDSVFYVVKSILEIVFLVLTKNYIVYLIVQILCTIFENLLISYKANKMFPYLKEKNAKELSKGERNSIFSNVKSLVVYKLGVSILGGTDNIIISALMGVSAVGLCSNYTLIIESIKGFIMSIYNGITASVGNLNVAESSEKKEKILYDLTFINFWIYGFCAVMLMILLNPFIELWLGKEYILSIWVPIAMATNFFVCGLRTPAYTYRVTMGLFKKGRITPFIASVVNIVLSILLGKIIGVSGVIWATAISQIFSYCLIDPYLIYKYELKTSIKPYVLRNINYYLAFFITIGACFGFTNLCNLQGIYGLILKATIVTVVFNLIVFLIYKRTEEFNDLKLRITDIIKKKI